MTKDVTTPKPLSTKANALWNMSGCIFYLGCQWLTTVFVVIFSKGFDNSGALAFAMSVGNMFASLSLYKIRTFQVSDVKNQYSSSEYVAFRIFTISASLILSAAYLALITQNLFVLGASMLYLVFKIDETFVDVLYGVDQKYGRMDYIGKSQFIRGIASLIGFSLPIMLTGNLILAILGMTILCVLNTVIFDWRHSSRFCSLAPEFSKQRVIALAKACLLPTIANFCATSIVSVARQQYGILAGEDLLGIYASIATPAVLVQAGAAYLYSPLIGHLGAVLLDDHARFKKLVFTIFISLLACMAGVSALLSTFCPNLLVLVFGVELTPHVNVFLSSLLATTSVALLLFVNDALLIRRDGITQVVINAAALCFTALFSSMAIELWGMAGINYIIILATLSMSLMGLLKTLIDK